MHVIKHSYISVKEHSKLKLKVTDPASSLKLTVPTRSVKVKSPRFLAIGLALAHVKYLQHRPGDDRPKGGRMAFDELDDAIDPKLIRQQIKLMKGNVVLHKIMLSPEVVPADLKDYTRHVMHQLSQEKGQDMRWWTIPHGNTEHHHANLIILPVDRCGKRVTFRKKDYESIKRFGDDYIRRNHPEQYQQAEQARLDKQRAAAERRREERRAARQSELDWRVDQGLELPWLHQKIVREQLEPFEQWKRRQWFQELESIRLATAQDPAALPGAAPDPFDTIEADGKTWSKENSLSELKALNSLLNKHFDKRIPLDDYRTLVQWIKAKEEAGIERDAPASPQVKPPERTAGGESSLPKQFNRPRLRPLETIEALGKQWTNHQTLDKLQDLDAQLWQNKEDRIAKEEYKKLVRWIREKERELEQKAGRKEEAPKHKQRNEDKPEQRQNNEQEQEQKPKQRQKQQEDKEQPQDKSAQQQPEPEPPVSIRTAPGDTSDCGRADRPQPSERPFTSPEPRLRPLETIEAIGRKWTNHQSLDELEHLDIHLWQNKEDRIPKEEYKKLVRWIGEKNREQAKKEQQANTEQQQKRQSQEQKQPSQQKEPEQKQKPEQKQQQPQQEKEPTQPKEQKPDQPAWQRPVKKAPPAPSPSDLDLTAPSKPSVKPDYPAAPDTDATTTTREEQDRNKSAADQKKSAAEETKQKSAKKRRPGDPEQFEFLGKTFSKETSLTELTALNAVLRQRQDKNKRLPAQHYKLLKHWIEWKDRERFSGVIERQLASAKRQHKKRTASEAEKNSMRRYVNPLQQQVMKNPVMGIFMSLAGLAAEVVRSVPLKQTSDPVKQAQDKLYDAQRDAEAEAARNDTDAPAEKQKSHQIKLPDPAEIFKCNGPLPPPPQRYAAVDDVKFRRRFRN